MTCKAAWSVVLALTAGLAGCGSEDEESNFGKDVEGVYAIETWTSNENGCDVEGPDVLGSKTDKKLGVKRDEFVVPFLVVSTCADAQDCANQTGGGPFASLGGATILERQSGSAYTTEGTVAWSTTQTGCTGSVLDARLEKLGGDRVRFETKRHDFENVPPDGKDEEGNPECDGDKLREIGFANPCLQLDAVTAAYEGEMPAQQQ